MTCWDKVDTIRRLEEMLFRESLDSRNSETVRLIAEFSAEVDAIRKKLEWTRGRNTRHSVEE